MKAATYERYGPPEAIAVSDVPAPVPNAGEVLVRVRAAAVNSWDWDLLTGNMLGRTSGLFRPKYRILGADVAGTVEAVGPGVARFRPGDAVMGDLSESGWGGFAEFVAAAEKFLVPKPDALSFAEAAALPQAGMLALQAMRKAPALGPERRVLINGAGGGVGSFAIQLAKRTGAEVTAVDHGSKTDFMRSLGADRTLDYTKANYALAGRLQDLVVEMVAKRPAAQHARVLRPEGRFVVIGGSVPALIGTTTIGGIISALGRKKIGLLVYHPNAADLAEIAGLAASGALRVAIDTVYPLERTGAALRHVGEGKAMGKVVVEVAG
ncbi:MAG: NAD(P)-dependent alcohol dehydrogenase [Bauldia sp.]|nr:NAD(P)-dependent alcohol dehydrogenase [Bauldia sp.]